MPQLNGQVVLCACGDGACGHEVTVEPRLESQRVVIEVITTEGRAERIWLTPGWARILADRLEGSANAIKPRIAGNQRDRHRGPARRR